MAMQKVTVEIPLELLLLEQKLVRAAYAAAEHPDHVVARQNLKAAVVAHQALTEKIGDIS